ncbi:23S rRNA pseudouridylate synthase [Corynebacterium yudongzhengii]|uniref:RNA pseudouridylate synthase n=1 Tax=Corynebacterium yudongzhengii TaxID=2080740 RepID=A0A2U1T817_9CORY|nr:pseudouridine synthase [Corynebacterium yudongzhengii]AWB82818.1 23S rRNA pseudouridylate synthase [Corynebacterium yudongzhengii]PWC02122.1 23S rRNA pseudouridylate synthase [Corynebacterium yudongzhengii]
MAAPIPSEENSIAGWRISSKFMRKSIAPLPIRDGLNPTRVRVPHDVMDITAGQFVTRLIETQRHRHPHDDTQAILNRFSAGEVVDSRGRPLAFDSPVPPGTDVWFYRMPAPEKPVPYEIVVVHEDERLMVVDKPPFLATMPRAQHITETATVRLRRATGNNLLVPAHRLDRLTAGLLVFTKYPAIRSAYQRLFAERKVEKVYEAIAPYSPELAEASPITWENRIHKEPGRYQAELIDGPANARTLLARVDRIGSAEQRRLEAIHGPQPPLARYELHPHTGRTHQLRLHMWTAGVPILGDGAYPTPLDPEDEDFCAPLRLTARRLSFRDPIDHTDRTFETHRW